jgi:hypothetical protein
MAERERAPLLRSGGEAARERAPLSRFGGEAARAGVPEILTTIAEEAGDAVALTLWAYAGGTKIYIPRPARLKPDHWLAGLLGWEAAQAVARAVGGGDIDLPLGCHGNRARTGAIIAAALAAGATLAEAARRAGVCQRTVSRHRLRRGDQDQLDLFGE